MRSSVHVLFAGISAAGLLMMGATPALAAKGGKDPGDDSTVTAASEGGDAGNAGNGGFGLNVCPAIAIAAKAEASCDAGNGGNANGGDAEAFAEDDSRDTEESEDE